MHVATKLFGAFFILVCLSFLITSFILKDEKKKNACKRLLLLLFNLAFFMYAGVRFVGILIYIILITYFGGIIVSRKKKVFPVFVVLQLLPLVAFKAMSWGVSDPVMPLGISFFTLQSMTYLAAVYKDEMEAEKDIILVAVFVSLFLNISSGPIMRAGKLMPQLKDIKGFDYDRVTDGLKLYAWGIFKKLVLADNLAIYIQGVRQSAHDGEAFGTALFLTAILYSFQLYLDFAGYSDIVTGCGKILGFELTRNFDHPYLSKTVSEFWRRWHISLSSWLRDFVYIPLGGSRTDTIKIYRNLMIVFIVSGFWHGTGMTFIVWGLLHGLYVCADRVMKKKVPGYKGSVALTFVLVSLAWIFFSAESVSDALNIIASFGRIPAELAGVITGNATGVSGLLMVPEGVDLSLTFAGVILYCAVSIYTNGRDGLTVIRSKAPAVRWSCYFAVIFAVLFFYAKESVNFIYNQF